MRNDVCDTQGPLKKEEECRKVNNKDEMRLFLKKKKEKQSKLRKPCMAKECKNIIGKDSIILRDDRKCNYPASL